MQKYARCIDHALENGLARLRHAAREQPVDKGCYIMGLAGNDRLPDIRHNALRNLLCKGAAMGLSKLLQLCFLKQLVNAWQKAQTFIRGFVLFG
jgi:hypothetical protein